MNFVKFFMAGPSFNQNQYAWQANPSLQPLKLKKVEKIAGIWRNMTLAAGVALGASVAAIGSIALLHVVPALGVILLVSTVALAVFTFSRTLVAKREWGKWAALETQNYQSYTSYFNRLKITDRALLLKEVYDETKNPLLQFPSEQHFASARWKTMKARAKMLHNYKNIYQQSLVKLGSAPEKLSEFYRNQRNKLEEKSLALTAANDHALASSADAAAAEKFHRQFASLLDKHFTGKRRELADKKFQTALATSQSNYFQNEVQAASFCMNQYQSHGAIPCPAKMFEEPKSADLQLEFHWKTVPFDSALFRKEELRHGKRAFEDYQECVEAFLNNP